MDANDTDRQHLDLLAIFHYVYAALIGLFSLLGFIYVFIGAMIASLPQTGPADAPAKAVGIGVMALGGCFILFLIGKALLALIAGRRLARRRSRTFCFVVAAIECLNVPFGTVLGVFTIVVLSRPSVIALFEGELDRTPSA